MKLGINVDLVLEIGKCGIEQPLFWVAHDGKGHAVAISYCILNSFILQSLYYELHVGVLFHI